MEIGKFIYLISICGFLIGQASETEQSKSFWKKEAVTNLNFTQNSFDNWTQGGENSWSWQADVNISLIRSTEQFEWSNNCKISFGKTKVGSEDPRKAADEIKFESVYTKKLSVFLNPYFAATGQTQFTKGWDYSEGQKTEISDFLDPGYFTQSIGFGYAPNKIFKTRIGAAIKETVANVHANDYSDSSKTKTEYGAESTTDLNLKISNEIVLTSRLEMFSDLNRISAIDVKWENLFTAKVSKYINISLNLKLFYDNDVSKKRQLQQTLAIGLTYVLF